MASLVEDPDGTLRALVDHLGHDLEPSILIGGWATYLRVGGEISHDIDLIIGDDTVRTKLRERLDELNANSHLQGTNWSGEVEGVHLDIHIPYQSMLGARLRLRVEVLARHAEPADDASQRWLLLRIEAHTVSKIAALLDRWSSVKGIKDANEILALLRKGMDAAAAVQVLAQAADVPLEELPGQIDDAFRLVAERGSTNREDRKWLDRLRREWLDHATAIVRRKTSGEHPRPTLS